MNGNDNYMPANSSGCSTSPSLLLRACGGESLAWQRMVQIYGPLVYNWARRTGLQPQDAADVAQETFAAVSTRLSRFDPQQAGATFRGWLWTITRNKAADFVRARDAQPRARGGSDPAREFAGLFSPSGSTNNNSGDADQREVVRRALAILRNHFEKTTWQAFWRTVIDDCRPEDVAEELGVSKWTIYKARSRVLQRLRGELGGLEELP